MAPSLWTTSDQKEFLDVLVADYRTAQKEKSLTSFWAHLYEGWFQKFPELPQILLGKELTSLSEEERQALGDAIRV